MAERNIEVFFRKEYYKLVNYVQKNMEKRYSDATPEDIVQDVTLSLLDKFNIDAQIENLAGYFYRSLRNRIYDTQKKKGPDVSLDSFEEQKREKVLDSFSDENFDNESVLSNFEPEQLQHAINLLNDEDKYIINETHFGNRSFQELSKELNTPIGTLLSRKHRAQDKLAKILSVTRSN